MTTLKAMPTSAADRRRNESLDRRALEQLQLERLNSLLAAVLPANRFYAERLAHVALPLTSLDQLGELPLTGKHDLVPEGGPHALPENLTWPMERYARYHQTSGTHGRPMPVYDTAEDWQWWIECWQYVLDAADVTAASSSVQKPAGSVTYTAANLLDGDPRTAWNSNGDKVGDGKGVTLTFTFSEPVDLKGIALLNGYQKKIKDGGKSKDLFKANGRVAALTVTTDGGETTWDVGDGRAAQKLEKDLGETSTVTLTVSDVYPGGEYEDLALSEVSFIAER